MQLALLKPKFKKINLSGLVELYREPIVTFCVTPNNNPEMQNDNGGRGGRGRYASYNDFDFDERVYQKNQTSEMILNILNGLFSRFYIPERIRFHRNGIKIKMSDVVSYKVAIIDGKMKFYLSVPKRWSNNFKDAIRKDWGQVDITEVGEQIIDFNPSKAKAMEVSLRHHYALSLKHNKNDKKQEDSFYSSIASLGSTLGDGDKVLIDYNIQPISNNWKDKANKKIKQFKSGKFPNKEDAFTINGIIYRVLDFFNVVLDEFVGVIDTLMGAEQKEEEKKEQLFDLKYSDDKIHANTTGYNVQIRVLGESSIDDRRIKLAFKNIETSFSLLNGDNQYIITRIRAKRGVKSIIKAVNENRPLLAKPKDILFGKEVENILKIPSKQTCKEYKDVIVQDNFTRAEIHEDFFKSEDGGIPFAFTLDKQPKQIFLTGYKRDWWTDKGRYVKKVSRLDDRSTPTMVFGRQGGGKTNLTETQILYSFGAHLSQEEWKEKSKSVIAFDVADGAMINRIFNHIPDWLKHRVVVLNHGNFNNPISINNADLDEYNSEVMHDDDYSYILAEMESKLVLEILGSERTIAMDRWFTSALQCIHSINKDWGYIEAMRLLIDDDFRQTEVIPKLTNRRLQLEMNNYNTLAMAGGARTIIQTIENRFSQLERDQKLWDCIAQKPFRDENGKVKLNFRTMLDGDEDGAYLILVHIPKSSSNLFRKFVFAHYFTKVWNVLMSRESGFGGREYRPETLVAIDEIHQIIDIPIVAKLFIDIFKETRKYSGRYWFTLHGWSSLSKAGRGLEGDIKQSIMDNGCNLIFLKGGAEAFKSLEDFTQPFTIADFNGLMNQDFCGIFAMRCNNKNHVFQAKLGKPLSDDKKIHNQDFTKYDSTDSSFLTNYQSPYGRNREEVRNENLDRSSTIIENAGIGGFVEGEDDWRRLEQVGMTER